MTRAPIGPCSARSPSCVGGVMCLHAHLRGRDEAYFAAACSYAYESSAPPAAAAAAWPEALRVIEVYYLRARISLAQLVESGGSAALLGFLGVTLGRLVVEFGYTLEQVLDGLNVCTWRRVLDLGFEPALLADATRFPAIVFYDSLGMRAESLVAFGAPALLMQRWLGANGSALLDIDWTHWK